MTDTAKRTKRTPAHLDRIGGSLRVDARVIRSALRAADIESYVDRVTSGRHTAYITTIDDGNPRDERAYRARDWEITTGIADVLRMLWADSGRRVSVSGSTVHVERYSTLGIPALPPLPEGPDVPEGLTLRMWALLVHEHGRPGGTIYISHGHEEFGAALDATGLVEADPFMADVERGGYRWRRLSPLAVSLVERAGDA